jgi:hypothetical protein
MSRQNWEKLMAGVCRRSRIWKVVGDKADANRPKEGNDSRLALLTNPR